MLIVIVLILHLYNELYVSDEKDYVFGTVPQTTIDEQADLLQSIHENAETVGEILIPN